MKCERNVRFYSVKSWRLKIKLSIIFLQDFSEWIDALLIAMKYKKELKPTEAEKSASGKKVVDEEQPPKTKPPMLSLDDVFTMKTSELTSKLARFYTCPLDQVNFIQIILHDVKDFLQQVFEAQKLSWQYDSGLIYTFCYPGGSRVKTDW